MIVNHTRNTLTLEFGTWSEFIEHTNPYAGALNTARSGNYRCPKSDSDEADVMSQIGWLKGAEIARSYYAEQMTLLQGMIERERVEYDVVGASIDVPSYVQGAPDCWMKFDMERMESTQPKFLRFVVNIGASGGVAGGSILARGAALCALVDILEMSGTRCEIAAVDATDVGGMWYCSTVTVKQFDQPFDLPMVCYAIGHPYMLRVHTFRLYERMSDDYAPRWCDVGYGPPAEVPAAQRGDLYIPKMHYDDKQWQSATSTRAWILNHLKTLGVSLVERIDA